MLEIRFLRLATKSREAVHHAPSVPAATGTKTSVLAMSTYLSILLSAAVRAATPTLGPRPMSRPAMCDVAMFLIYYGGWSSK